MSTSDAVAAFAFRYAVLSLAIVAMLAGESFAAQVWAVGSTEKVRQDARPEGKNAVWAGEDETISVKGARNEHVPFQLVIFADEPPLGDVTITASDLTSGAAVLDSGRIGFFLEHEVKVYATSDELHQTGLWPDALVPLTRPFTVRTMERGSRRNPPALRTVWVDVFVPADAAAGVYAGTLSVSSEGKEIANVKVSLEVWDFALPDKPTMMTYLYISDDEVARNLGVPGGSAEARAELERYYRFLIDNRMNPWFHDILQPAVSLVDGKLAVDWSGIRDEKFWIDSLGVNSVILNARPPVRISGTKGRREEAITEQEKALILDYVKQVYKHYEENGWADKLIFNSPIDEPNSQQEFDETRTWADLVHAAAPKARFLVTRGPLMGADKYGSLVGYVNVWVAHGNGMERERNEYPVRSKAGDVCLWYSSCDQRYPLPNVFIERSAADMRMVPWITWRYKMSGYLYWRLNWWHEGTSVWWDPVTWKMHEDGPLGGEGMLLYPGREAERYTGQDNVEGPVASIRFALLREGIEDWEYLNILKELGDEETADRLAESIAVSVDTFTRNADRIYEAREKAAKRILELAGKK